MQSWVLDNCSKLQEENTKLKTQLENMSFKEIINGEFKWKIMNLEEQKSKNWVQKKKNKKNRNKKKKNKQIGKEKELINQLPVPESVSVSFIYEIRKLKIVIEVNP